MTAANQETCTKQQHMKFACTEVNANSLTVVFSDKLQVMNLRTSWSSAFKTDGKLICGTTSLVFMKLGPNKWNLKYSTRSTSTSQFYGNQALIETPTLTVRPQQDHMKHGSCFSRPYSTSQEVNHGERWHLRQALETKCFVLQVKSTTQLQGRSQDFSKGVAEIMEAKAMKRKNCLW